jgi:hypothetical protein
MDTNCCLLCGKTIPKRENETIAKWEKRKYCSVSCGRAGTKVNHPWRKRLVG